MKNRWNYIIVFSFLFMSSCTSLHIIDYIAPSTYDLAERIKNHVYIPPIRINVSVDAGAQVNNTNLDNGTSIVHLAAGKLDNDKSFKRLIDLGGKLNIPDKNKYYPVHYAAKESNNISILEYVLQETPSELQVTSQGNLPIHIAAEYNPNLEIIKTLLAHTKDPNVRNKQGVTPLMFAAKHQEEPILQYLLEQNADINETDAVGHTALQFALQYNPNPQTIEYLIESGANPDLADKDGNTALHYAAKYQDDFDIIRLVFLASKKRYARNIDKKNIFDILAIRFSKNLISSLDKAGSLRLAASKPKQEKEEVTLLSTQSPEKIKDTHNTSWIKLYFLFVLKSNPQISLAKITQLLNDVDIKDLDFEGVPILFHAIKTFDRLDIIKLLIQHGADVKKKSYLRETTLHYAARYSTHTDIILYLLKEDIPIAAQDVRGNTALHYAARYNQVPDIYLTLISAGASPFQKNNTDKPASLFLRTNSVYWGKDLLWASPEKKDK